MVKGSTAIAVVFVMLGATAVGMFTSTDEKPVLEAKEGWGTVSYEVPTDGSTPESHSGLENIGYMARRLKEQPEWYSEMQGVVNTVIRQDVFTFKQYSDGVLISTDISKSSMINTAKQLCYVGDSVLWREAAKDASEWNGIDTEWKSGDPTKISVDSFKTNYGLPATEFSVYILNEDTVTSWGEVKVNGDGTYTQDFVLNHETDKAPFYYRQQMLKTGGLSAWPEFTEIKVSYTFDAAWQVLKSEISEAYGVTMGPINTTCTAAYTTLYEYGTERCRSGAYDEYFCKYENKPATEAPADNAPTSVGCLTSAFGSVLTGPSVFDVSMVLNGKPFKGTVYADIANMEIRAEIGALRLWYTDGVAYLSYGGVRVRMSTDELLALVAELLPSGGTASALDTDALLRQLGAGEFTYGEGAARLKAELSLMGLNLPVEFSFLLDENNAASLESVKASVSVKGLMLDASLTFGEEGLPALSDADKRSFTDLMPYVDSLVGLFKSEWLNAEISYSDGGVYLNGDVALSLRGGQGTGLLTVASGAAAKTVSFGFTGGNVYLNLDGVKVRANAQEAVALVLGSLDLPAGGAFNLGKLLQSVFDESFADNFLLSEADGRLSVAVKGTELLRALGLEFALGGVNLSVANGEVTANALGAKITVKQGSAAAVDTDGFTDILPYANALLELFKNDNFAAELTYTGENFSVAGTVQIRKEDFAAAAEIAVTVGETVKNISVLYADDGVYFALDGLKIQASVSEAFSLITELVGTGANEVGLQAALEKILSLDFSRLIELREDDGLSVTIKGTQLLNALGVQFALGDVVLGIRAGELTAEALGARISLTAGEAFSAQVEGYYADVTPVLKKIPAIVQAGAVSFGGLLDLTLGGAEVTFDVKEGALSWKDGLKFHLDATLCVLGTKHDIALYADRTGVSFAYGAVGAALAYEELPDLESAFVALYIRIKAVVDTVSETETSPMPAISGMKDLLAQLGAGAQLTAALETVDFGALLGAVELCEPKLNKGLLAIALGGVYLELADETEEGGFIGGVVRYKSDKFSLSGEVHLIAPSTDWRFPSMPEISYLGVADFAELFDYVGAAAELVTENELAFGINATVAASDAEKYPDGVKYDVSAKLEYSSGGRFPAHLDLTNKNFYLDSGLYLHAAVDLAPRNSADDGFFLELYLLDQNPDGTQDGTLDFYVTVSRFAKGANNSDPLKLYAPADEIMTLVSALTAALGVDNDFVNGILVSKWLDAETADQLRALGASLIDSTGLKDIFDKLFGGAGAQIAGLFTAEGKAAGEGRNGLFKEVSLNASEAGGSLKIVLDSSAIYGVEMPADITLSVRKAAGERGSYLTGLLLGNVYGDKTAAERTDVALEISRSCARIAPAIAGYTNAEGIDSLLKTIVNSATHVLKNEQGEIIYGADGHRKYELNEQFYIDGEIKVSAGVSATVKVRGLSVRVGKDNRISADFGISYNKVTGIIKAKSELDLTMKDGMVYMKRVAEAKGAPEVIYRAMPLENFMSDILEQLIFIFNFDDLIANTIRSSSSGGSSQPVGEVQDFGALMKTYLSSYSHGKTESGNDVWNVALNGAGISGGLLGDINIGLYADKENALRNLSVLTKLYSVVTVKGELAFRNPCNVWDKGVTDKTTDIHGVLEEGLGKALREVDWTQTTCVEGELKELFFVVDGEDAGKQSVVVGKNGELYADVRYPDLSAYEEKQGYTLCWTKKIDEESFAANATAYASYVPNVYNVTLESIRPLDGYTYDEGKGVWAYSFPYTYGTELSLPAQSADDKEMRVSAFVGGNGAAVSAPEILSDTVLTAVWEYIDYTVTYVADGETLFVQTAHFGDKLQLPAAPEKQGYTFAGWSASGAVTGNMTVAAQYAPMTFLVTLTSEKPAEGFAPAESGYKASFAYTYGETVSLPVGAEYDGYFLAAFVDAQGNSYTELKNILRDVELAAKWEAVGYKVTFAADGVAVGTRNFLAGESISSRGDLPPVPEKAGYTGEWNISEDTVNSDMTVNAVYTPNTYRVTLVSEHALNGFTADERGFVKTFDYVYGSSAIVLDSALKIPCYDFGGYYTMKNGAGERITKIENILSDTALYLHWTDNTVAVKLYSDVAFDGADGKDAKGYYKTVLFNDDYTLNYAPAAAGYQTLGWWTEQGGAWSAVSDVKALDGAELWALWIKDITVNVTEFYTNSFMGSFLRYNVGGNYTGGTVYGLNSEKIADAIGLKGETTVLYQAILESGKSDNFSGGSDYPVEGNFFKRTEMNHGNTVLGDPPVYGGAEITRKFTANGKTVTTSAKNYISLASYKVIYLDEEGNQLLAIENVHNGYYQKTTLGSLGAPDIPVKRGHTGAWSLPAETQVNSDLTVHAMYTANVYGVTFTSESAVEGWEEENGAYALRVQMAYGAAVSYYAGGTLFASASVSDGANVFALPEIPVWNGKEGAWTQISVSERGAEFYAEYPLDSVVYSSEITFTYNGAKYDSYRQQYEGEYSLITPVAEGYTFLGWYDKNDGWKRVEKLSPTADAGVTEVEALWISDAKVSVSGSRDFKWGTVKYNHRIGAELTGGVLVGAFADEAEISVSYRYYVSNNTGFDSAALSNDRTNVFTEYRSSDEYTHLSGSKNYGHAVATVTYTYGDMTFTTGEVHGYTAY